MQLSECPVAITIPTSDIDRSRRFYERTLGLTVRTEHEDGIEYEGAQGSTLFLYPTRYAGTAQHTLCSWICDDVEEMVDDLRSKGIQLEQYDQPELKTNERGIARSGDTKTAWFKDPDGNILAVSQFVRTPAGVS